MSSTIYFFNAFVNFPIQFLRIRKNFDRENICLVVQTDLHAFITPEYEIVAFSMAPLSLHVLICSACVWELLRATVRWVLVIFGVIEFIHRRSVLGEYEYSGL
jgi:hypothetical protein